MTDSEKELVKRLRAWAEPVESGYEIPAAGRSMREAADAIETLVRERDEARVMLRSFKELSIRFEKRAEAAEAEVQKWHGDAVRLQSDNIRLREALQGTGGQA